MGNEEDCKERYENSIIAELRMENAKLKDEKCKAESELESCKIQCKELSERLSMLGKGVDTQEDIGEVTKQSPVEQRMEKSIYVHILRFADGHTKPPFEGSDNPWYVIKQGEDGVVECTPAFGGAPQIDNPFDSALMDTTCGAVGSLIFTIGGTSIDSYRDINPQISNTIQFMDTHRPKKDGWQWSRTLPFYHNNGFAVNVDDEWLVVIGGEFVNDDCHLPFPVGFALNVHNRKFKWITAHPDFGCAPLFATCLFPGTVHVCMDTGGKLGSLVKFDIKNNSWTPCEEKIPYPRFLCHSNAVDDGIFYSYDSCTSQFLAYDLRQNVELYVVQLPPDHTWFPRYTMVNLLVLSNNSFCILWDSTDIPRQLLIKYSRFSVSGDVPKIVLQDTKAFPVPGGYRILNAVAVAGGQYFEACSSIDTMTANDFEGVMISREGTRTDDDSNEGTSPNDSCEGTISSDDSSIKTLIDLWNNSLLR